MTLPPGSYDIVAGFHLLEHIPEPETFLNKVVALLKTGGLLFLVTPNTTSQTDQLFGWDHPMFTEPDHVCLYAPATLRLLLEQKDFEIVALDSREPLHHCFTSLKIFLKQSSLHRRQILGKFIKPYFFTAVLRPWLKRRSTRLEKQRAGHEIVVIARKQ